MHNNFVGHQCCVAPNVLSCQFQSRQQKSACIIWVKRCLVSESVRIRCRQCGATPAIAPQCCGQHMVILSRQRTCVAIMWLQSCPRNLRSCGVKCWAYIPMLRIMAMCTKSHQRMSLSNSSPSLYQVFRQSTSTFYQPFNTVSSGFVKHSGKYWAQSVLPYTRGLLVPGMNLGLSC